MANTYSGGCHCGAVRYEVTTDLAKVMSCNCSICSKKGSLLTFVPEDRFKLLQGNDAVADYLFNKKVIHHTFCKTCGIGSFARGVGPKGPMIAVNVRCLDGVDVASLPVTSFDGKSL